MQNFGYLLISTRIDEQLQELLSSNMKLALSKAALGGFGNFNLECDSIVELAYYFCSLCLKRRTAGMKAVNIDVASMSNTILMLLGIVLKWAVLRFSKLSINEGITKITFN